ncbi:MAG: response regulator [Bacteroidales bacterium]
MEKQNHPDSRRRTCQLYLYRRGIKINKCKILKAVNGKEAVEMFRQHKDIDLVIMDIKMPEMDGYEATKYIKEINQNIPVISQSAYAMPGDIEKGFTFGINDYLIKPVKPKRLLSIIDKHLKNRS